jgi:hypothetical protein
LDDELLGPFFASSAACSHDLEQYFLPRFDKPIEAPLKNFDPALFSKWRPHHAQLKVSDIFVIFSFLLVRPFGIAPFFKVGSGLHFFFFVFFVTLGGQPALNRYFV